MCIWKEHGDYENIKCQNKANMRMQMVTHLKAMIIWPELDTGFAFSRYAVKLSSFQRISGWVWLAAKEGDMGEPGE